MQTTRETNEIHNMAHNMALKLERKCMFSLRMISMKVI